MEMPASTRRPQERRSLLGRMRRRRDSEPLGAAVDEFEHDPTVGNGAQPVFDAPVEPVEASAAELPPPPPAPASSPPRRRDARHVRAVPTNAQVKVERALELFNSSEHVRTIGGIQRTLGEPWVSANPLAEAPSEVSITVAWELSWYRYRVDLGDAADPVTLVSKGQELDELDESMRDWNATALADGKLAVGART
jgi:hypothetical protein